MLTQGYLLVILLGSNNDGGTLIINGSLGNEVVFQGDRLEDWYQDAPGQWSQIWLCAGSKNSTITMPLSETAQSV